MRCPWSLWRNRSPVKPAPLSASPPSLPPEGIVVVSALGKIRGGGDNLKIVHPAAPEAGSFLDLIVGDPGRKQLRHVLEEACGRGTGPGRPAGLRLYLGVGEEQAVQFFVCVMPANGMVHIRLEPT
mmetsp:Transcript_32673/g.84698  ORF Transcript_32673/g.84698 Transcript_32673/m.84698 type:complete len:126 (-) Transcript_32673:202-579(-)